jgi:iron complex outermembrane receptor protein
MRPVSILAIAAFLAVPAAAFAEEAAEDGDATFTLGQIVVTAQRPQGIEIGGETLTAEAI